MATPRLPPMHKLSRGYAGINDSHYTRAISRTKVLFVSTTALKYESNIFDQAVTELISPRSPRRCQITPRVEQPL